MTEGLSTDALSPEDRARVRLHLERALALMHRGHEQTGAAITVMESHLRTVVEGDAQYASSLARVDQALAGELALTDLTAEERAEFNHRVDEEIRSNLGNADYASDLLASGVTVVVLEDGQLLELRPDGTSRRLGTL